MSDIRIEDIIKEENKVFEKTPLFTEKTLSYCPGCGHGVAHRLVLETIQDMGIESEVIGVAPVGCSVLAYEFMNIDMAEAAHGRATAMATGIKRVYPDKYVFTYQGDGDLAAIGTGETIHTCNRGEDIVIIFINNGIYGMTGGQMAPTTLPKMRTSTSPHGRDTKDMGYPLKITELVAQLPGTCFVARHAVHTPALVRKTKKAIRKAFEYQKAKKGTAFIEIVSNCNSGWKLTPLQSVEWLKENMLPFYELGTLKQVEL